MNDTADMAPHRALRDALARLAYDHDTARIADPALAGWDWLATSHRGVFAIAGTAVKLAIHGWFFGICHHDRHLFLFENCGQRDRETNLGRIIRFDFVEKTLNNPRVVAKGLHNNCHQLAVIDGLLCVVDTGNQAIRRYTVDGAPVDVKRPIPVAGATNQTGAYAHINSIAKVGARIGLILHNGKAIPSKNSEILWLDENWKFESRVAIPGHQCHDIVEDGEGRLWHSLSREGQVLRSDGVRIAITSDKMTRGIAVGANEMAVGVSTFGPRHMRGTLNGSIVMLRRSDFAKLREIDLIAAPADVIAI